MKLFHVKLHEDEKNNLILFCGIWLIYVLTGFAKSNYAATISYIVSQNIYSKSDSGLIAASFYILYGIGQIFGGKVADKFSPYKIITLGVAFALVSNLILSFTYNYTIVLIVWSINGLMQFGIWPGISKIISTDILPETRQRAGFHISYGLTVGSILSYLIAALLLNRFGWYVMFGVSSSFLVFTLIVCLYISSKAPKHEENRNTQQKQTSEEVTSAKKVSTFKVFTESGILLTLIPAILLTMLSNGAQVWVPTMLMESYTISSAWASVQTVVILAIQVVCLIMLMPLLKKIKNEMFGKLIFYAFTLIPFIFLIFIGKIPQIAAIFLYISALLLMSLAGALNVNINTKFNKYGLTGTISGLVNAMSAFGIVLASGLYGTIAEYFGSWTPVTVLWVILVLIIIAFYIPAAIRWKKFTQE